ncbi:helix-turn-helix transcriptional regulator [bacterium]|nr:helix-turn-helix transcriptional regulator [bacterium]
MNCDKKLDREEGGKAVTSKIDIGLAIKTRRKKAGIKTQKELGKKLNPKPVGKDTINRIENGYGNYGIDILFRIAEVLGCDISDFLGSEKKDSKIFIFEGTLEELKDKIKEG